VAWFRYSQIIRSCHEVGSTTLMALISRSYTGWDWTKPLDAHQIRPPLLPVKGYRSGVVAVPVCAVFFFPEYGLVSSWEKAELEIAKPS